jgi:hypothetical protein
MKVFFSLILVILSISLSLQTHHQHHKEKNDTKSNITSNLTDKISDYFTDFPLISTITEKWNNFTNAVYDFFNYKHPRTGNIEDLRKHMKDFNTKISDFFKTNMKGENYSLILDKFSDRMSFYMRQAGKNNATLQTFSDKFYDFSDNVTDWLKYGYDEVKEKGKNTTDKFNDFLRKVGDYFHSNYTSFNTFIEECRKGNCPTTEPCPNCLYEFTYHYHRGYKRKNSRSCDSDQLDMCGHKCQENQKVLCDCYVLLDKNNQVDCVCADNVSMCDLKHTHSEM